MLLPRTTTRLRSSMFANTRRHPPSFVFLSTHQFHDASHPNNIVPVVDPYDSDGEEEEVASESCAS
jgi:hypothetical protein